MTPAMPFAFVNELRAAELREEIYAGVFDQATEPFGDFVERDDVVAFVLEGRRSDGKAEGGVFGEERAAASSVTGVSSGADFSKSGTSSASALGFMMAPESWCAPISRPFSRT